MSGSKIINLYREQLSGQFPDLEEFRPGVYEQGLKEYEKEAIRSCTPGAEKKTPITDELYDRNASPHQPNNVIKDNPKTAKDLFVQLSDFMTGLKAVVD